MQQSFKPARNSDETSRWWNRVCPLDRDKFFTMSPGWDPQRLSSCSRRGNQEDAPIPPPPHPLRSTKRSEFALATHRVHRCGSGFGPPADMAEILRLGVAVSAYLRRMLWVDSHLILSADPKALLSFPIKGLKNRPFRCGKGDGGWWPGMATSIRPVDTHKTKANRGISARAIALIPNYGK